MSAALEMGVSPRRVAWRRAVYRFGQSRLSLVGLALSGLVLAMALFGGLWRSIPST